MARKKPSSGTLLAVWAGILTAALVAPMVQRATARRGDDNDNAKDFGDGVIVTRDGTTRYPVDAQETGKMAHAPHQMPARAWLQVALRVKDEITQDRVLIVAAGVTFYVILSLFPLITAFGAIYGLFADLQSVDRLIEALRGTVPPEMLTLISEQLGRLVTTDGRRLGLTSGIALAIAFWSANGGVKGMMEALNVAYDETETRSFVKLNLTAMALSISGMIIVSVLLSASAVLPPLIERMPVDVGLESLILWGRWPFAALLLMTVLAALYRFGPDRRSAKWRWVTPGAVGAALGVMLMTYAFGIYTASYADFSETYGSIGTVMAVMLWIWLASIVVIVGAEINAESEHQTAQDTTVGPDRPLGTRRAAMADKVAGRDIESDDPADRR